MCHSILETVYWEQAVGVKGIRTGLALVIVEPEDSVAKFLMIH